jgi:hypothetical protein
MLGTGIEKALVAADCRSSSETHYHKHNRTLVARRQAGRDENSGFAIPVCSNIYSKGTRGRP